MLVPGPQEVLVGSGWVVPLQRGALATHIWEGAAPQLCSRQPVKGLGPFITSAPAARGLSTGRPSSLAWSRHPSRTPSAISQLLGELCFTS